MANNNNLYSSMTLRKKYIEFITQKASIKTIVKMNKPQFYIST